MGQVGGGGGGVGSSRGGGSVGSGGVSGKQPCKYMRITDRRTRVAEVVVNAVGGGGGSGAGTGVVIDPRLAALCGSGTFAKVIELPYVNPNGAADANLVAVFILPSVNIGLTVGPGGIRLLPRHRPCCRPSLPFTMASYDVASIRVE